MENTIVGVDLAKDVIQVGLLGKPQKSSGVSGVNYLGRFGVN